MSEPQAKGINFRSFTAAAKRLCGPDAVERMLPHLPAELAKQVQRDAFVTGGWYPLADFRRLHEALQRGTGQGLELARAIGRDCARDDFSGIYRVLTFVLSPEFLMRRTPAIWKRYYDVGVCTVEARAHYAKAEFREATGFSRVLWLDVMGGSTGVLESCGAKDVKMLVTDGGGDEDHLTVTATWS